MDNVSKIKDRLGIVDVLSSYLKLQKTGINFKAPCPFHNEKTPSFFVSPERQIWKCFGCGKGGDVFTFVKEIEGVEFPEALRILASRAGVELEGFDSALKDSKERLYQICESSARFFEKQLGNSGAGKRALEYLKNRGLEEVTITKFRLGFAPATWDSLTGYLRNSGFTEKEIVDAGMAIKRQPTTNDQRPTSGAYDRFRSRIMFPVADVNSQVVGFTGRICEEEGPSTHSTKARGGEPVESTSSGRQAEPVAKYINTPQTLIYDKSRILYGLNHTRGDIKKNNKCLLVEGNMDAIMSHQAGVTNVVASSGTALTGTHLSLLKRYTGNLDFCFDTDSAGALATKRGIGMALGQDFSVKVVSLGDKECKDPADYVKKYGKKWSEATASAKPAVEFYFDKAKENYQPESAESKKNFILAVAPFVKRLTSRVEKAHWINRLAYILRVKEDAVENDIISVPDDLNVYETQTPVIADKKRPEAQLNVNHSPTDVLNETLLSLIIKSPVLFKEEVLSLDRQFLDPLASQVLIELAKEDLEKFNFNDFAKKFNSDKTPDLEFVYLRAQSLWEGFKEDELKAELSGIFNKLKQRSIHVRLTDLGYDMKAAEGSGDKNKVGELAVKFGELTKQLAEIHKS